MWSTRDGTWKLTARDFDPARLSDSLTWQVGSLMVLDLSNYLRIILIFAFSFRTATGVLSLIDSFHHYHHSHCHQQHPYFELRRARLILRTLLKDGSQLVPMSCWHSDLSAAPGQWDLKGITPCSWYAKKLLTSTFRTINFVSWYLSQLQWHEAQCCSKERVLILEPLQSSIWNPGKVLSRHVDSGGFHG